MHELPTQRNLLALPVRGRVAYAARAALRVRPLYIRPQWPSGAEITTEHADSLDKAIELAVTFSSTTNDAWLSGDGLAYALSARDAADVARRVGAAAAAEAASAAACAASAVAYGADVNEANHHRAARYAEEGAASGMKAATLGWHATAAFVEATVRDFRFLLNRHVDSVVNVVDPTEEGDLGRLWPEGCSVQALLNPDLG